MTWDSPIAGHCCQDTSYTLWVTAHFTPLRARRSHVGQRRRTRETLVTSERDTRPSWKRVSTSRLGSRCVKFDPLISATKTAKHPVLECKNGMRSARCLFEVSFDAAAAERAGLAPVRNLKTDSR